VYHDGVLYEGTGLVGQSTLRVVDLETGEVLRQVQLPSEQFGEGIAIFGERLFQLTWTSGSGYVYDRGSLQVLATFPYSGEGWGLTQDGDYMILSNGTPTLRLLDPESLEVTGELAVSDQGQPVAGLNELEWVEGEIFANVWPTDRVARIDRATGQVLGWIDFAGLLPAEARGPEVDVLNGIAYDHEQRRLFVTGKRWPLLFEVELVPEAEL
jgi:glutaminyl-peptide cyclotransferase